MKAINLRWPITIQRASTVKDATGHEEQTWADLSTVRCDRSYSSDGDEQTEAQRTTPVNRVVLTIRQWIDIKETDRIKDWNDQIHKILFIKENESNRGVQYKDVVTQILK